MISIEASSIREINEQSWDAITHQVLSMSHRWIRSVEASWRFYEPHYLLLEDQQGPSAVIVANMYISPDKWMPIRWLYQRFSLVIKPPFSFMCSIVVRPGIALETILPELESALERLRQREKRLLTIIANVTCSDVTVWQHVGFLADPQPAVSSIDLPDTYETYLESLQRKDRQELRRIRKRAADFDVHFEIGPLKDDSEEIYSLLCEVYAKHGTTREDMPFTPQLFTSLEREMPGETLVIRGYACGRLAGVSINLLDHSMLLGLMVGLRYEIARPSFLYFLLQDEAIRWSIEHKLKRFYVGRTNEREKQKHGFKQEPRWLCYRANLQPLTQVLSLAVPLAQRFSQPVDNSKFHETSMDKKSNEVH